MTSYTAGWFKHELNCCTKVGTKCFKLWLLIWQNPQIQGCDIYCLSVVPQCMYLISHWQESWWFSSSECWLHQQSISLLHHKGRGCLYLWINRERWGGCGTLPLNLPRRWSQIGRKSTKTFLDYTKPALLLWENLLFAWGGRGGYRKVKSENVMLLFDALGNRWSSFDLVKQFWESPWFLWKAGTSGTVQGLQFK